MIAIIVTQANKHNKDLQDLEIGDIKTFNSLPKYWNNSQPYNALEMGFYDVVKQQITEHQRLVNLHFDIDKFTYDVEEFTQKEIDDYNYNNNLGLKVADLVPTFDVQKDLISAVAIESGKVYNEFTGVKESTTYVNEADEVVAVKRFSFYQNKGKKGTKLEIDYYDNNNEIRAIIQVKDYYGAQKLESFKSKCANRVMDRFLFDVKEEIAKMNFFINNATPQELNTFLSQFGIPSVQHLQGMMQALDLMFDDLFKNILFNEVLVLRNSGDSTDLYNALDTVVYAGFDSVALTSPIGTSYRDISRRKFNPDNFKFYE